MSEPRATDRGHYQTDRRGPDKAPKMRWFPCSSCDKKFRNPNALKLHREDNHKEN